jgi:hypothetical protein
MSDQSEIFPPAEVAMDSPKLRWLAAHGLNTFQSDPALVGTESPETGEEYAAWYCMTIEDEKNECLDGYVGGATEQEACANFAIMHGIRLWNEGGTP